MRRIPDNLVGAMAEDIHRRGGDPMAVRLLRDAATVYRLDQGRRVVLKSSVDEMDRLTSRAASDIVNAGMRAGVATMYDTVVQELAPTSDGWRDRLAELTDWGSDDPSADADWSLINERVGELRSLYQRASTPDDRGDVGRRCRQLMTSAVAAVFRPSMTPEGQDAPQEGNTKERFKLILIYHGQGSLDDKLKSLMDKAWDLAAGTLHHDNAGRPATFAVAQATVLVVRTLGVIKADLEAQDRW